jgi:type IV secretion system protein VirB6
MLELAVPILAALTQMPGQVDPQAAMAFFLVGAVHMALMILVLKVSATMVSGWRVFGLVPERGERRDAPAASAPVAVAPLAASPSPQGQASAQERRIPVSSFAVGPVANDAGSLGDGGRRDTRVVTREVASAGAQVTPLTSAGTSRARGIGSRYKAPGPRLSEKVK